MGEQEQAGWLDQAEKRFAPPEFAEVARQIREEHAAAAAARGPGSKGERRYQDALADLRELITRQRDWLQEDPAPVVVSAICACGTPADRICLGCGVHACGKCLPLSGGKPHEKCGGPVWGDGEQRCPPVRNPTMRGY